MAEAVALAASVAGLVGLTGQIIQGTLFIQKFFEDVRDAPAEVGSGSVHRSTVLTLKFRSSI
jgi:hypothetical protein